MRVRNRIFQLQRAGRLEYGTVPLPEADERRLVMLLPDILRRIADPEIFEFVWQDSQMDTSKNPDFCQIAFAKALIS